jgi:hypothetical protein
MKKRCRVAYLMMRGRAIQINVYLMGGGIEAVMDGRVGLA